MMETFIVLGLCFILYEALDFFQGCINSATPPTSDQIDAYRRQLDEQRQQQQQEQFLATLSPLLTAQLAALTGSPLSSSSNTPTTASTASVISELRAAVFGSLDQQQLLLHQEQETSHSLSTPALGGTVGISGGYGFRPAQRSIYSESQELQATSSLPRDYYYLQQQQLKNKNCSKPLLSKFSNSSDNRIYPEATNVLGVPTTIITSQPLSTHSTHSFDCQPPVLLPAVPLGLDLKRAILNNNLQKNINNNTNEHHLNRTNTKTIINEHAQINSVCLAAERRAQKLRPGNAVQVKSNTKQLIVSDTEDCETFDSSSTNSSSNSSGGDEEDEDEDNFGEEEDEEEEGETEEEEEEERKQPILPTQGCSNDQARVDDRDYNIGSGSSSHTDFREIECERLRRKCVNVKRIYSISEKF